LRRPWGLEEQLVFLAAPAILAEELAFDVRLML